MVPFSSNLTQTLKKYLACAPIPLRKHIASRLNSFQKLYKRRIVEDISSLPNFKFLKWAIHLINKQWTFLSCTRFHSQYLREERCPVLFSNNALFGALKISLELLSVTFARNFHNDVSAVRLVPKLLRGIDFSKRIGAFAENYFELFVLCRASERLIEVVEGVFEASSQNRSHQRILYRWRLCWKPYHSHSCLF